MPFGAPAHQLVEAESATEWATYKALEAGAVTQADIRRMTGASSGAVRHDLDALMDQGAAVRVCGGRAPRYALTGRKPRAQRVYDALTEVPHAPHTIADIAGCPKTGVRHYLDALESAGVAAKEGGGRVPKWRLAT